MKIRLGNIEDTFKHPTQLETAKTLKQAMFNRMTDTKKLNEVLMVWDDQDNLLVAKDISKILEECGQSFPWVAVEDLNQILEIALKESITDEYGG